MKILHDWIKFAEEFEMLLGQNESKWRGKVAILKAETQIQLGLVNLKKDIDKDDIDIILESEPKNIGEISDQIGYGHKYFDND